MKRVACVWFPDWPLQRLHDARPELERRPLLLAATERGVERVVARSPAAARAGVAPGITVAEARTLCGDGVLVEPHDPPADHAALETLARWCHAFSPTVGLAGPDGLLLDVTGCDHLHGGERPMLRRLHRALGDRGFRTRLAIADTIGTAWAVCRGGRSPLTVVPPGGNRHALRDLPVESLRLEPKTLDALHELAVTTVGRLERLPRSTLPARFGKRIVERLDQAHGRREERFTPVKPLEPLRAGRGFEPPLGNRGLVEEVLFRLLDRLLTRLRERREGVLRLDVRLDLEDAAPLAFTVGCVRSTDSAERLRRLLQLRLERTPFAAAVCRITLEVAERAPLGHRRTTLFEDESATHVRERDDLVERLAHRLGDDAVLRPHLVPEYQPELACELVPAIAGWPQGEDECGIWLAESCRPSCLLGDPRPVEVISRTPHGPPLRVRAGSRTHVVSRCWGPERIQTGWWRSQSVNRDYYRIETATGHHLWLYRRLEDAQWFLHGFCE